MKLPESFYQDSNVVQVARKLLGKVLITNIEGKLTGGMIVETEAYSSRERGCHAYDNRKTNRNKVMFDNGGVSYVYLCYGVHHLFNVVTNEAGKADAVLIRALEPVHGAEVMMKRMGTKVMKRITSGPGKLSKALGIDRSHNGEYLLGNHIWIEDAGNKIAKRQIQESPRIGIDYAGEDALLPWRFTIRENKWVSK